MLWLANVQREPPSGASVEEGWFDVVVGLDLMLSSKYLLNNVLKRARNAWFPSPISRAVTVACRNSRYSSLRDFQPPHSE